MKHKDNQPTTAEQIIDIFLEYRRPMPGEEDVPLPQSTAVLAEKLQHFIDRNEPIDIVFPAFPWKSNVRDKTLSDRADKAEDMSLTHLASLNDRVAFVYAPGSRMRIYSDGGTFHDALVSEGYTPESRAQYREDLNGILTRKDITSIAIIDTEDLDLSAHEKTREAITQDITSDKNLETLYAQQKKFWSYEVQRNHPDKSRRAAIKYSGGIAKDITRMSAALSAYIDKKEPEAIRFSCHPKALDSGKVGIYFSPHHVGCTPWHGAAVMTDRGLDGETEKWTFMKSAEAQQLHLDRITSEDGTPSHYEVPADLNKAVVAVQRSYRERLAERRASEQTPTL